MLLYKYFFISKNHPFISSSASNSLNLSIVIFFAPIFANVSFIEPEPSFIIFVLPAVFSLLRNVERFLGTSSFFQFSNQRLLVSIKLCVTGYISGIKSDREEHTSELQ